MKGKTSLGLDKADIIRLLKNFGVHIPINYDSARVFVRFQGSTHEIEESSGML